MDFLSWEIVVEEHMICEELWMKYHGILWFLGVLNYVGQGRIGHNISYISGPFLCTFLIHHCLCSGLFRTHSPTQAHHLFGPGLSLIYSWTILLSWSWAVQNTSPITQAYHLFGPSLCLIHPWAISMHVLGTTFDFVQG